MFGRIESIDGRTEPVTLAGPNPGIVEKVDYTNTNDYPLVMTQGCLGMGNIGYASSNPITYNPFCIVGTDEDTGEPIRKGVLVVDCIKSESIEGGDCAKYLEYNTANDNTTFNIPLWGNSDTANGYREQYVSGGYPITYNPITGLLTNRCSCVGCQVRVGPDTGYITINGTCICGRCGNSSVLHINGAICAGYGSLTVLGQDTGDGEITTACVITRCIGYDTDNNWAMEFVSCNNSDVVTTPLSWCFDCNICVGGNLDVCNNIHVRNGICTQYDIIGCYQDTSSMTWYIYCDGTSCFGGTCGDIEFEVCGCICTCCLVTCFIDIGCDANFSSDVTANAFHTDSISIYSSCIIATEASSVQLPSGTTKTNNYANAWANCTGIPNCNEIRCYLYCHCGITGYSSGNTLYLRSQACAQWS